MCELFPKFTSYINAQELWVLASKLCCDELSKLGGYVGKQLVKAGVLGDLCEISARIM